MSGGRGIGGLLLGLCACTPWAPQPVDEAPPPATPTPELVLDESREPDGCLGLERLDWKTAPAEAMARGYKAAVHVPAPVRCPELPTLAAGADNLLAARGELAPVLVDVDGFLRPEVGVAEALALLGPPVLCDNSETRWLGIDAAPRDAGVLRGEITVRDGEMTGISIEFDPPVTISLEPWIRRFGAPEKVTASLHAHLPDDVFTIKTGDYAARLVVRTMESGRGEGPRRVRKVALSRSRRDAELPRVYRAERELVAVTARVLRARAIDAHELYGYVGTFRGRAGARVVLRPRPDSNVFEAWITAPAGAPHDALALHVRLRERVPVDPTAFAAALAFALGVPPPQVAVDGEVARIAVRDGEGAARGEVVVEFEDGRARTLTVTRADAPAGPSR